jgi:thiamine biosynthesis lipoprotein ApbE
MKESPHGDIISPLGGFLILCKNKYMKKTETERKREYRRKKGVASRTDYEAKRQAEMQEKLDCILYYLSSQCSLRKIAEYSGIPKSTVQRLLRDCDNWDNDE